jgi:hypothetical protein
MANAAFYVNDIRIIRHGEYLVLVARRRCPHGGVFDEVYLTMPEDLASFFNQIESCDCADSPDTPPENSTRLEDRFKRFSSDN